MSDTEWSKELDNSDTEPFKLTPMNTCEKWYWGKANHLELTTADMVVKLSSPEWISVKERLPEDFVDVLCCCINKLGQTYEVGERYMSIDSIVIWTDTQERSFRTDRFYGEVTHWMPLPEPPKE